MASGEQNSKEGKEKEGNNESNQQGMVYGMNERPGWGRSFIYAFQHIFAMILGSITGGVIIGEVVGLNDVQTGLLIGYINVAVGIATILQVKFGVKLPVIQGSTMGHVPAYLALGGIGVSLYDDPMTTMQYLGGALLIGAILEGLFGGFNLLKYIMKYISPITVGIVIMMVGLGLWSVVVDFIGGAWGYAMGVIILVMIGTFALGVTAKTMAIFSAVLISYAVAAAGSFFNWFPEGHPLYIDFKPIVEAQTFILPKPFPWGWPKFNLGFIVAMTIPYIATAFESMGDYIAVSNSVAHKDISTKKISRGILIEGIASSISSALGGTASSSFSQNVGVVRLTGVASLFVCILAGCILIALGVFGKFGTIFASIPKVILGSVYLIAFGILVMTGLRLVLKADVKTSRNETIIGSALLLGLALPYYMKDNPLQFDNPSLQIFANVFLATPMMVSGLWVFVLDNIVPGTDKERGIDKWIT